MYVSLGRLSSRFLGALVCLMVAAAMSSLVLGTAKAATGARVPVSLLDTLSFQKIDEVSMAPDGHAVAYVTQMANLKANTNPHELAIVGTRGGHARVLLHADDISDVSWAGNGRFLYAMAKHGGDYLLEMVDASTGATKVLLSSHTKIDNFTCASHGNDCVFTTEPVDTSAVKRRRDKGMVYRWGRDTSLDILHRNYTQSDWEDFHLLDERSRKARLLYHMKYTGLNRVIPFVSSMMFSPDGRYLAITVLRAGAPNNGGTAFNPHVVILNIAKGTLVDPLPTLIHNQLMMAWSADSRKLLFISDRSKSASFIQYDVDSKQATAPFWAKLPERPIWGTTLDYDSSTGVAYVRAPSGEYELDFKHKTVSLLGKDSLPVDASCDRKFASCAFIDQAPERRPEVAVYDKSTKETRRLTDLNPWLEHRILGKVKKINVVNDKGVKVFGYLVYPINYDPNRRYPLIVDTYGFRDRFILQAQWQSAFPAQALAGRGYAVLLLNVPPSGQPIAHDPSKARDMEGWQMMSTLDNAIEDLEKRGVADPTRIGISGWSHGGFVVEFMLAHSSIHFKAATLGEGGTMYNPGGCWGGGVAVAILICDNVLGGPLGQKTAKTYFHFSPVFNLKHFNTPLLMEFSGRDGFGALETYVPLRVRHVPAELVTYDDEPHVFVKPRARLASMQRKVDWFNYWMLDKEDPDPVDPGQYARWDSLRKEWMAAKRNHGPTALRPGDQARR